MRLWHESLLPLLPTPQLLGQHRECCALRGLGWGRPHSTVNYVFDHPRSWLAAYHRKVLLEMIRRGYKPDLMWMSLFYRGKHCIADELTKEDYSAAVIKMRKDSLVYPEHNDQYLRECLDNLANKGIEIPL